MSGSGVSDSHSSKRGKSWLMSWERRDSPVVSSSRAARVWATSWNPKAASRSSAASWDRGPEPAMASSSGRKNSFSWIDRTWACWRRWAVSNCSRAVAGPSSR